MPITVTSSGAGVGVEDFQTHEIGDVAPTKDVPREHEPGEAILAQRAPIKRDSDDVRRIFLLILGKLLRITL